MIALCNKFYRGFIVALPAIIFIVSWEVFTGDNQRLRFLFGSPFEVIQVFKEELARGKIWRDIYLTALEAVLGLVGGSMLGTMTGLLLWSDRSLARVARPYVIIVGAIPIFAIAPMLIIWFGTGLLSKVVMAGFAVFFISLSQAYDGARLSMEQHGDYAATLGAGRMIVMSKIVLPGAIHWVVAGLKISVGLALVGAFIGEFVSSEAGLGHYILSAGSLYDMPRVILGILLISGLALCMNGLLVLFERWKPNYFVRS